MGGQVTSPLSVGVAAVIPPVSAPKPLSAGGDEGHAKER